MAREISRIEGMRECREALQELGRTVQRNVGKRALKQGPGRVFVAEIKRRAPVSSRPNDPTPGSLRDSVKVVDARTEKGRATVAILAEDIAAVPNEYGLKHRRYKPHPFFRPGIDAGRDEAGAAMAAELKSEVDVAVAKAAKRAARAGKVG
jgi:hypothetical protein